MTDVSRPDARNMAERLVSQHKFFAELLAILDEAVRAQAEIPALKTLIQQLKTEMAGIDGARTARQADLHRVEAQYKEIESNLNVARRTIEEADTIKGTLSSLRTEAENQRKQSQDAFAAMRASHQQTEGALKGTIGELENKKRSLESAITGLEQSLSALKAAAARA